MAQAARDTQESLSLFVEDKIDVNKHPCTEYSDNRRWKLEISVLSEVSWQRIAEPMLSLKVKYTKGV